MTLRLLSALAIALLATTQSPSNIPSQIALTHVTVIDVRNGSTKPDITVLLLGSRIGAVGSSKDLEANRLEDMRDTKRIVAVFSEGKLLDQKTLDRMAATTTTNAPTKAIH